MTRKELQELITKFDLCLSDSEKSLVIPDNLTKSDLNIISKYEVGLIYELRVLLREKMTKLRFLGNNAKYYLNLLNDI